MQLSHLLGVDKTLMENKRWRREIRTRWGVYPSKNKNWKENKCPPKEFEKRKISAAKQGESNRKFLTQGKRDGMRW